MFKKLLAISFAVITVVSFGFANPALAGDAANGGKIFAANCAACHAGGNNVVNAQKTLKKEALKEYGKDSVEAIVTQVTNGNGAMPAFGGKISASDIEDVATYVLSQAESGW